MTKLYEELRVPPEASPEEIKKAYRKRARATHPDKGGKTEEFQAVNKAYQVLSDPVARKSYDETGNTEPFNIVEVFNSLIIAAAENIQDPVRQDVLKTAAIMLDDAVSKAREQIKKFDREIKKWQQIKKRLRKKRAAADSPILRAIEQRITGMEHETKKAQAEIEHGEVLRKMLAEYEYKVDKEPQHGTTTFTSFITSKF